LFGVRQVFGVLMCFVEKGIDRILGRIRAFYSEKNSEIIVLIVLIEYFMNVLNELLKSNKGSLE
jgi:hypothetical protein